MRHRPRRGAVIVAVLILMPLLFLVMVLAIYAAELVRVRSALQANADAAALAAAGGLVDDRLLLGDPLVMPVLLQRARENAQASARENIVGQQGIDLHPPRDDEDDEEDREDADLEFGHKQAGSRFEAVRPSKHGEAGLSRINAVRVWSRRTSAHGDPLMLLRGPFLSRLPTDASARAVALIERDILGIRPVHGIKAPLAPIALLSDAERKHRRSWEYNAEDRKGPDRFAVDHRGKRPAPASGCDGLHELAVSVGCRDANGVVLALTGAATGPARQAAEGVTGDDLAPWGRELVLGASAGPAVPAARLGREGITELAAALRLLSARGDAHVFPLHRRLDREGRAELSGFVAARILAVEVDDDGVLHFAVQPAMRSTPAAVSASSRGRTAPPNPYLCRLRLAD